MTTEETLTAYCVKCRQKRPMRDPHPVYAANGSPGTRGTCPVCSTALFRVGRTPAHADLPKPEVVTRSKSPKS